MRDIVSIDRVKLMHPGVRYEVPGLIDTVEMGLPRTLAIRTVEVYRTIEYQNELFAQGRTKPGHIVTNAKGGASFHNYGLALDFAILVDKDGNGSYDDLSWDIKKDQDRDGTADWLEVVHVFEKAGWFWGGKFSSIHDYPHLQKTFGFSWQQLLERYRRGDVIPGTKYVRL